FLDRRFPKREILVAPGLVTAEADKSATVIENNLLVRKFARQRRQLRKLRMEQPGIEGETKRREARKAFAEGLILQQVLRPRRIHAGDRGIAVPRRRMADALETAVAGLDLG